MILEIVCVVACLMHAVIGFFHDYKLGKKVDVLCSNCGTPLLQSELVQQESSGLSSEQLSKLVDFVKSIKGGL